MIASFIAGYTKAPPSFMNGPELWFMNRGTGFVLLVLLTLSVMLGVLSTARVSTRYWPRMLSQGLHRNVSLLAVAFLLAHVGTAVADTQALSTAMGFVSQQRVAIDNSLSRMTAATEAVSGEKTQLTVAQTSLMQADVAQVATQLSLSKAQQTALEAVISQLGSDDLFSKL